MMRLEIKHPFPVALVGSVLLVLLLYHFLYYIPFTNNAFVVANVRPVAANVSGYVTHIAVKNEQYVKKGQPLFTVFQKPYELAYQKALSDVKEAKAQLQVYSKEVEKTRYLLASQKERYEKSRFNYDHYKSALSEHAVSAITAHTSMKDRNAAHSLLKALNMELELHQQQMEVQKMKINALTAVMNNAKVNLDETVVYAQNNGVVQNMFMALGTPVKIREPLFSFVDTDTLFIQANFYETDLRRVQPGDKVTIYPRVYLGAKRYHGVIYSKQWAASRLETHQSTQLQIVSSTETNWFLLPQRLPIQIQITDYDAKHYPLSVGESAYVYIHASG